ncbi:MAG: DNA starvation/stationary phase protection protein Dps, partial [Burkholderiales bacterium]|nr:DNA starvation/stationary phase protection protein Dps [Opitutaceae bacterium]
VAKTAREAIRAADKTGDAVTADVFTEVARGLDTLLWKVEAHVALEPRWEPAG